MTLIVAGAWAALLLAQVIVHPGWPANHDSTAPAMRMGVILEQWRLGNFIPVWSSGLQFGHGSPLPALYHKTFLYLSALLLAATGSVKAALTASTFLCLVVAFGGMAFCVRQALGGRHHWIALVAGALLAGSNYVTTDWLVRGAFAELSALALLPWLLGWCIVLLREGRWPLWLGPLLAGLVLSHSILAVCALLPVGLALAMAVWRWRPVQRRTRSWVLPSLQSGALAAVLLLPFVLPLVSMGRFNRTEELVRHFSFTPMTHRLGWQQFVWDAQWTWGAQWGRITAQLDTALLVLSLLFFVLVLIRPTRPHDALGTSRPGSLDRCLAWFLAANLAVFGWLQTPFADGFFMHVPGVIYLQFAWRLLAYITPLLVLGAALALALLYDLAKSRPVVPGHPVQPARSRAITASVPALALAAVFATVEAKLFWHPIRYEWIPASWLEASARVDYLAMGEFFPLVDAAPATRIPDVLDAMKTALDTPTTQVCRTNAVEKRDTRPAESRRLSWQFNCPQPAEVTLPVFVAPGMRIDVRDTTTGGWRRQAVQRTCADPRPRLLLPAGPSEVQVRLPNWRRAAGAAVRRPEFDFRRDCQLHPAARLVATSLTPAP